MLLHSGASIHGHEFSAPNNMPRRSTLVRSAFSATSSRSSTSFENNSPASLRPIRRLSSDQPRKLIDRVSFQEPPQDVDTMTEDDKSYASEASETTAGGTRRKRRSPRSSTIFYLAHPAPTLTSQQKLLHIRPKLLFQLQRLSPGKRPIPSIDVMPATVVVPRLMKKFPRMFRGKAGLGANDVIIVKSEDYDSPSDSNDELGHEEDHVGNREMLAVICQIRGSASTTEICLSDGSVWVASTYGRGIYEFQSTDAATGETTKARWVQRILPRRQDSSNQRSDDEGFAGDISKFNFSLLDPNSRRHPILASLTRERLDIPDTYTTCSPSSGRYPPTSPIRAAGLESAPPTPDDLPTERTTHALDEATKSLIKITSIWIALKMGWSSHFSYNDSAPASGKSGGVSNQRTRSVSVDHARLPSVDSRTTTPEIGIPNSGRGSKILNPATLFNRSSTSSAIPVSGLASSLPKRSVSNGTAFMQRQAAKRVGQPQSTVPSDSEGESVPSPHSRVAPIEFSSNSITTKKAKRMSTPSPLAMHDPDAIILNTPTRPHRRVQSAYYPNNHIDLQNNPASYPSEPATTPRQLYGQESEQRFNYSAGPEDRRNNGWRRLLGFFRRGHNKTV